MPDIVKQKIGDQLDKLGLELPMEAGDQVVSATVEACVGADEGSGALTVVRASVPNEIFQVPHPVIRCSQTVVRDGQELTEEQRARVAAWLEANGIAPKRVARTQITIEWQDRGGVAANHLIGFHQFLLDDNGCKFVDERSNTVATVERWVRQTVPLEDDPEWGGWEAWRAAHPPVATDD